MADKPFKIKTFTVMENGHKMDIIIPQSKDEGYDSYLAEAEIAKTKEELRNKPAPKSINPEAREILGAQLKEYGEYQKRKADNSKKWF